MYAHVRTAADADAPRRDYGRAVDVGLTLPFTQRLSPRAWIALDIVFAATFAALAILVPNPEHHPLPAGTGWDITRAVGILIACTLLPLRRWRPRLVLVACTAVVMALIVLGVVGPVAVVLALCLYTATADADPRLSLAAGPAVVVALLVAALLAVGGPVWGPALSAPALALAAWLAGLNRRVSRAYARGLAARAAEQADERVERATGEERLRIARELHDVVAHTMSVIAVRSGVGRMVLESRPEEAGEALAIIETTSRRALAELRLLVTVLRRDDADPAELGPTPGLADLPELVGQIRDAGVSLSLGVEGAPRPLSPGVDVSAYRIAQEALTNVVRHAPGSTSRLTVRYTPHDVEIEVCDDGRSSDARSAIGLAGAGGGHGLVGMRERVAVYGGELRAGPADHGFRVVARLPTIGTDS
jgi:signal transduction histidine kinase